MRPDDRGRPGGRCAEGRHIHRRSAEVDETLTSAQLRTATERLRANLADIEQQIADAGQTSALTSLMTAQDVHAVWDELPLSQQRAVINTLMNVKLHRSGRGARRFSPDTVEVEWKTTP